MKYSIADYREALNQTYDAWTVDDIEAAYDHANDIADKILKQGGNERTYMANTLQEAIGDLVEQYRYDPVKELRDEILVLCGILTSNGIDPQYTIL